MANLIQLIIRPLRETGENIKTLVKEINDVLINTLENNRQRVELGISSGTYLPVASGTGNITTVTPRLAHWTRIGNQVTVTGALNTVDPINPATETYLDLSLPIASAFTNYTDCSGVCACGSVTTGGYGWCYANVATGNAVIDYISITAAADPMGYTFTYTIK